MNNLEAPWVGNPPEYEEETYICPECGRECEKLYIKGFEVLGCDNCIDECDCEDWEGWDE